MSSRYGVLLGDTSPSVVHENPEKLSQPQVSSNSSEATLEADHEQQVKPAQIVQNEIQPEEKKNTYIFTQKATQISNIPNGIPSNSLSKLPDAQTIEEVSFRLRRIPKTRVNADVPVQWKERLDETAHELKVGKYELLVYIIAEFLGEV
jgi:hypothetical protein